MRTFLDWEYIGTAGYAGFSVPGFTQMFSPGVYNVFLQSDPVLRVKSRNVDTRWADVTISASGNWYDSSDPLEVELHVYLEAQGTVYVPLREALAPAILRKTSGLSIPQNPSATCDVRIQLKDSSLTVLGTSSFYFAVFDSLGDQSFKDWRGPVMPDTWRVMAGGVNYFTLLCGHWSDDPTDLVYLREDLSDETVSLPDDGTPAAFTVTDGDPFVELNVQADGERLAATRLLWEGCNSDKMLLRWWSPEAGGWKSCVADVVGGTGSVTAREEQLRGFGRVDAVSAVTGFALRFPRLTFRDWQYYRDILFSDEVVVDEVFNVSHGGTSQGAARAVRVSGDPGGWRLAEIKDFNFSMTYDYLSEI